MVFGYVSSDDLDLVGGTDFSDEISRPCTHSASEHWFVVLSSPHEMVLAIKDGMA